MKKQRRHLLNSRAADVLAVIEGARAGDASSQHRFRVAARSLRADLNVLSKKAHAGDTRKTRQALAQGIRTFAVVRDLDVGREILVARGSGVEGRGQATLSAALIPVLASDRAAAMASCGKNWPRSLDWRLRTLINRPLPRLSTMKKRARREIRRRRSKALALLQSANRFDAARVHDLRKAIRRLRYALELRNDLDPTARIKLHRIVSLQAMLGQAQDHVVLSGWLSRRARRSERTNPALATEMRAEGARHRAQASESWEEFRRLHPARVLRTRAVDARARKMPRHQRS